MKISTHQTKTLTTKIASKTESYMPIFLICLVRNLGIGNLNNELKRQYPSYQRGAHSSSAVLMSGSAAIYFAATVIRLTVPYVVTVSYLWLLITDPTTECNNKGVITVITPLCCCVRVHQCQLCSVGLVQQPTTSLVCCVKCVRRFSSSVL